MEGLIIARTTLSCSSADQSADADISNGMVCAKCGSMVALLVEPESPRPTACSEFWGLLKDIDVSAAKSIGSV